MRREHVLINEPGPPFKENLIFWAPLTEGDFTDHISGVTGAVVKQDSSITWNANKQMYKIITRTSYSGGGFVWSNLNLGLDYTSASTVEFTMHAQFIKDSVDSNTNICRSFILGAASGSNYVRFVPYLVYNESRVPNYDTLYNATVVVKNGTFNYYIDGGNGLVTYGPYNASVDVHGLSKDFLNKQINIGLCYPGVGRISTYVKDMRLYNRALTAQEVAQL